MRMNPSCKHGQQGFAGIVVRVAMQEVSGAGIQENQLMVDPARIGAERAACMPMRVHGAQLRMEVDPCEACSKTRVPDPPTRTYLISNES